MSEDSKLSYEEKLEKIFTVNLTLPACDFEKVYVGQKSRKAGDAAHATMDASIKCSDRTLTLENLLLFVRLYFEKHQKQSLNMIDVSWLLTG